MNIWITWQGNLTKRNIVLRAQFFHCFDIWICWWNSVVSILAKTHSDSPVDLRLRHLLHCAGALVGCVLRGLQICNRTPAVSSCGGGNSFGKPWTMVCCAAPKVFKSCCWTKGRKIFLTVLWFWINIQVLFQTWGTHGLSYCFCCIPKLSLLHYSLHLFSVV